jgi:hypothetical protein
MKPAAGEPSLVPVSERASGVNARLESRPVHQSERAQNLDLGARFPQLMNIANQPAIPLQSTTGSTTFQAIANVPGDRERCGHPFRVHRAGRIEPVSGPGPQGHQP